MGATTDHDKGRSGALASPLTAAAIAAAALVAQHVLGKALRDALFLSHWPATRLPIVMTAATALSSPTVVLVGRLISRHGPARVIRPVFALHAAALAIEWLLARTWEPLVAVAVYLHTACLGAIILSAFWSVVSEAFDPHSGKRAIGRIAGGAALGGVVGGGLAWGGSHLVPLPTMLLVAAALSLLSMWGVQQLTAAAGEPREATDSDARPSGFALLSNTPYLRMLAGLVVVGAMLQALLDFQLGAQAKEAFGSGARLLSFFAIFQTVVGVASFLLQVTANRPVLERLGIGGTIGLLPLVVGGAGISGLAAPSLVTAVLQRGAEGMLRGSLFRSAYEVLFTPLPKELKRPTKLFIDVSLDRLGGLVGGGLTMALLAGWPVASQRVVTTAAVILAAVQLLFAFGLHRGYVVTLTERLRTGALKLDPASVVDATTRKTLSRTMASLDRATLLARIAELRNEQTAARDPPAREEGDATHASSPPANPSVDDVVHTMALLRSGDAATIRAALRNDQPLSPLLAPQVIDLLGQEGVAREAMHALALAAPRMVGTILDAVLDERRDARVRRRAARLLRNVASQRVVEGLVSGLAAESFDVRHSCARVLVELKEKNEELRFDARSMFERARRQLEAASPDPRALAHTFDLLSLAGPREAMQLAYGALLSQDVFLRGVAREYLDVVLPVEVRTAMALRLSSPPPAASSPRPSDRALSDLLKSSEAIRQHLDDARRTQDPDDEALS